MQKVNNWLRNNLLCPGCWLCGNAVRRSQPLCPACQSILPHNRHHCINCALPLPAGQQLCGQCLKRPPVYNRSLIPFIYARPIDQLITALKFRQSLSHARLLGELVGNSLPAPRLTGLDALLPVPLHPQRLRQRGYNQALEIGRFIAQKHRLELLPELCLRIRPTDPQSDLPLTQRRRNLRNAFHTGAKLNGCRLGIIDDVVTSGHTVNELARCLKRAGAETITVIAVARADLPG